MMKKLLLLLLITFTTFALDDATVPNTMVDGHIATAAGVNENWDSLEVAHNRTKDSLEEKFSRFTDFPDSTLTKLNADTVNTSAIRGNPDVDSLGGNVVMDSISGNIYVDSATFGYLVAPDAQSVGIEWTAASAAEANGWGSVTYGNNMFVAVAGGGTNRVMYSSDGVNWTAASATEANGWGSVTYGNGLFVALSNTGTNRVMYSSDGINWSPTSAADSRAWREVTYGNGLFVAVCSGGGDIDQVMYSSDGVNWTAASAAVENDWQSVTYGNGLFVAVSNNGDNRAMYSSDGINWSVASAPEVSGWNSVTYGNGLFVAVSGLFTNRVMYSSDGVNWTAASATEANSWIEVTYGNGLFVAVSQTGTNRVMYSSNGINWTATSATEATLWVSVTYGNGLFVAVASSGTNRVMTSGKQEINTPPHNNIYQGETTFRDTVNLAFIRGNPSVDSMTITTFATDTLTLEAIRGNPDVDSLGGNIVMDSTDVGYTSSDSIAAYTLDGKLTGGANEIEGSNFDIDGGDVSAITVSGGLTWSAAQDLNSQALTNADINSGTVDGVTIGGSAAPTVTDLGSVATCDINGGNINVGYVNADTIIIPKQSVVDIISNVLTIVGSYQIAGTESGASVDSVLTINGGAEGQILYLHTETDSEDITIMPGGNIEIGSPFVLSSTSLIIGFIFSGTNWKIIN